MFNKLKQFKDLRDNAKKLQSALSSESVTVREAGDKVVMTINGNMEMTGLAIDNELLTPANKEKLQNAIKSAHGDALKKIQKIMAGKMQEMGGLEGMGIPGMNKPQ